MFLTIDRRENLRTVAGEINDEIINQGHQMVLAGRLEEAERVFQAARALDPRNGLAAYNLAVVEQMLGRKDLSEALFYQAGELDSANGDAFYNLAYLQFERHDFAAAYLSSLAAFSRNPHDTDYVKNLEISLYYFLESQYRASNWETVAELDGILESLYPFSDYLVSARYMRADLYYGHGNIAAAESLFLSIIADCPALVSNLNRRYCAAEACFRLAQISHRRLPKKFTFEESRPVLTWLTRCLNYRTTLAPQALAFQAQLYRELSWNYAFSPAARTGAEKIGQRKMGLRLLKNALSSYQLLQEVDVDDSLRFSLLPPDEKTIRRIVLALIPPLLEEIMAAPPPSKLFSGPEGRSVYTTELVKILAVEYLQGLTVLEIWQGLDASIQMPAALEKTVGVVEGFVRKTEIWHLEEMRNAWNAQGKDSTFGDLQTGLDDLFSVRASLYDRAVKLRKKLRLYPPYSEIDLAAFNRLPDLCRFAEEREQEEIEGVRAEIRQVDSLLPAPPDSLK
jgi:hypothetical protein